MTILGKLPGEIGAPNTITTRPPVGLGTPTTLTPKTPAGLGAPATLTPATEATSNPNNALIGYDNLLTQTTTPDAKKVLIPNTYERFALHTNPGGVVVKFQLSTPSSIDYIAIGAHNLGSNSVIGTVLNASYATVIGGSLTSFYSKTITSDDAILDTSLTLGVIEVAEIQFVFFPLSAGASVGVLYVGKTLEIQRSIQGGHSPADLSQKTSYQSTMSESGQFLGRTVTRRGSETSFKWRHLEPAWYRDNFQPFAQSAVTKPFFIQWKPSIYPLATSFGFTTGDIKPTNMGGGNDLMEVSFNFKGHSD